MKVVVALPNTKNVRHAHPFVRRTFILIHRTDFARNDYSGPPMTDILDIIDYVKPTALLGLSTISVGCNLF
jgi:hypothetical protein